MSTPVPAASGYDTSTGVLAAVVGLRRVMVVVERVTVRQLAAQVWIEGLTVDSS